MTFVLRKSLEGWSGGTAVDMIKAAEDMKYPTGTVNPGYSTIRLPNGKVIDIEFDMVVKRRNRSPIVNYNPKEMEKLYGQGSEESVDS